MIFCVTYCTDKIQKICLDRLIFGIVKDCLSLTISKIKFKQHVFRQVRIVGYNEECVIERRNK